MVYSGPKHLGPKELFAFDPTWPLRVFSWPAAAPKVNPSKCSPVASTAAFEHFPNRLIPGRQEGRKAGRQANQVDLCQVWSFAFEAQDGKLSPISPLSPPISPYLPPSPSIPPVSSFFYHLPILRVALYAKINVFRYPGNILRYPEVSQKYPAGILNVSWKPIYI